MHKLVILIGIALFAGCASVGSPSMGPEPVADFEPVWGDASNPAGPGGTANDAGFFFQDMPANPSSGVFFKNQDPNTPPVNFNQNIRGGFESVARAYVDAEDPQILRTGWIKLDVGDEMEVSGKLRRMASRYDATVMRFSDSQVTFKMPSSKLEALLAYFDKHKDWDLDEFDFSAWDRTNEFYSVQSRMKSAIAIRDRLLQLVAKADYLEDILKLEERLEQVQGRLDRYETILRDVKLRAGRVDVRILLD